MVLYIEYELCLDEFRLELVKDIEIDEKSIYLQYFYAKNFYRWVTIQKLPQHMGLCGSRNPTILILKNQINCQKKETKVYFRNQCEVSLRAAKEA